MREVSSDSEEDKSLGSEEEAEYQNAVKTAMQGQGMEGGDLCLDSSDTSSSDSESDEEIGEENMEVDEDTLQEELRQVNETLAANPYAYDAYIDKIKILKNLGDLDKLRETREKFSELYPLSDTLWLEWIRDENKLACLEEEKDAVAQLFERAIGDYLSVDIWLEYLNFCISRMDSEKGQDKCRETFERALGTCGLHVSMGSLVWDMYRDFEAALLGCATTEEQNEASEARFKTLCRRQLSVPLLGMQNTYEDIKSKIEIDENTEIAYKKALERLNLLEEWEGKLVQHTGENKIPIYKDYIQSEKTAKCNPARIQCLFERIIAEFPLQSSSWIEYLEYLSINLKIEKIVLDVAHRASRNCSWDLNVWLKYMKLVEVFSKSGDVAELMKSVFEKAILYCSSGDQAGTLWLKYLEFMKRNIDVNNPQEKKLEILRKTFDAAEQHLVLLLPEPNDYISEVLFFHARFEAQCAKKITDAVTELWKNILSRGYNQYAKTWLQYIMQEMVYGSADLRRIRSHFVKAVTCVQDGIETIANLWINFERDNGDLSTLQQCEAKISKEMAKSASSVAFASQPNNFVKQRENTSHSQGKKRKLDNGDREISPKKGRKTEDSVDSDSNTVIFKVPSIPSSKPSVKPEAISNNIIHGESIKHDSSKDNRTVFLSNLAFTTDENAVKLFFTEISDNLEIRLVRDRQGRYKGFGYVCFPHVEKAKKALGKDGQPITGRPVYVSKCDPDKTTRQKQFKYPTSLERNKLFVKGLPFTLGADELRDLFKQHGDLKDCRLVTFRNGHSKGLAYVEYIDEACAAQAILKVDGSMIGDKKISVAISNPPAKDGPKSSTFSSFQKEANMNIRRNPKAFVPRSVQMSGTNTKDTKHEPTETLVSSTPKSNQEFRNLFLK